ncbi:23465_t:CDS:2 [Gigaspora rosea]|nr:23465_t:CDS:2 [Gigaspora rosea]
MLIIHIGLDIKITASRQGWAITHDIQYISDILLMNKIILSFK